MLSIWVLFIVMGLGVMGYFMEQNNSKRNSYPILSHKEIIEEVKKEAK